MSRVDPTQFSSWLPRIRILLGCLSEFADTAYQRRVWIEGRDPDAISDFAEAVCGVFDDADAPELLRAARERDAWPEETVQSVEVFLGRLDAMLPRVEGLRDEEVVVHPSWPHVVEAARHARSALEKIIEREG